MAIQIDSCMVCNELLTNDVITSCELCEAVFHKSCKKMTKQQSIYCKDREVITVYHAVPYFHFKISLMMNLHLKILQLKTIMTYIS